MKTYNIILLLFAFALIFNACDVVDAPYKVEIETCPSPEFPANTTHTKRVMIFDFTGHRCPNCPSAHRALDQLATNNPGQIIAVAIHAGFDARPYESGMYTYDFRTETGNELEAAMGIPYYPIGLVNSFESANLVSYQNWAASIQTEIVKDVVVDLQMINEYDATNRKLCTHIESHFLQATNGNFKLGVYLVENNIIQWQKDNTATPSDIEDYVHKHVLRTAINTTYGMEVAAGEIATNHKVVSSYAYTLDNAWVEGECSVVAFIYNDDTKEILQTVELHVTE